MATKSVSFSQLLLKLQQYWADQGCNILQPYDIPSGAGTFHPATLLRSLDSKPWSVAYVAPSRRPTDGRYGENPNRVYQHHQFQVIIKPVPFDIQDIYRNNHYWTKVRRAAGCLHNTIIEGEARVGRGLGRLLHVDDLERLEFLKSLSNAKHPPKIKGLAERNQRQFEMVLLTIFNPNKGEFETLQDAIHALWRHPDLLFELAKILDVLDDQIIHDHKPFDVHESIPLLNHAHYSRDEVLSAFGVSGVTEPPYIREGVYWHEPTQTDIFFITLKKSEKDFSPTTRYRDYAISETLFHWESQATTTVGGMVGQRYINHRKQGTKIALFIRPEKTDANGRTMPYLCAGLANYIGHESERPIAITWELETPLPGDLFVEYRAAVV